MAPPSSSFTPWALKIACEVVTVCVRAEIDDRLQEGRRRLGVVGCDFVHPLKLTRDRPRFAPRSAACLPTLWRIAALSTRPGSATTLPAMEPTFEIRAEWAHVSYSETSALREVYGFAGSQGAVNLEGIRFLPEGKASRILLIYMHPASTLQLLPVPRAMASERPARALRRPAAMRATTRR